MYSINVGARAIVFIFAIFVIYPLIFFVVIAGGTVKFFSVL